MGKSRARDEGSARADKKFQKKVQFYTKVKDTVASLSAQKSITKKTKAERRKKKLKAYDLSRLSESLPELKALHQPQKPTKLKLNSKNRQKLVLKESKQMGAVTNHPAFQSNPLEAIFQHLQSTLPPEDKKPKWHMKKKTGKRKSKKSKPQSMET